MVGITVKEQTKEKTMEGNKDSLRYLWDIRHTNMYIIEVLEGEDRNGLRKYPKRL